ncbi:hypothetical protein [Megasphaera elsdenii]|nr:hypothetical protein [Megasphaera elsdenii]
MSGVAPVSTKKSANAWVSGPLPGVGGDFRPGRVVVFGHVPAPTVVR